MTKFIILENPGPGEPWILHEYPNVDTLIEGWSRIYAGDIEYIFEVTREVPEDEIRSTITHRARLKMQKRETALAAARAALTPEQLKDLGLA